MTTFDGNHQYKRGKVFTHRLVCKVQGGKMFIVTVVEQANSDANPSKKRHRRRPATFRPPGTAPRRGLPRPCRAAAVKVKEIP